MKSEIQSEAIYRLNLYPSITAPLLDELRQSMTWHEFVSYVMEDKHYQCEDKAKQMLFDACDIKSRDNIDEANWTLDFNGNPAVRRSKFNVLTLTMLVVDFDGGMTMEDAEKRYADFTCLAYTSHSHGKNAGIDKFRMVFPLAVPLPVHDMDGQKLEFYRLFDALKSVFPGCDDVITKPGQIYYLPSCAPERASMARMWTNEGRLLDWREWPQSEPPQWSDSSSSSSYSGGGSPDNKKLKAAQVFMTTNGPIMANHVQGRIQNVTCPFHDDKNGSEFIVRHADTGVVSFTCRKCGTFVLHPTSSDEAHAEPNVLIEFNEPGDLDQPWVGSDRTLVKEQLDAWKKVILESADARLDPNPPPKIHVLYMPEGSGKSSLALDIVNSPGVRLPDGRIRRRQIVFVCKSYAQAEEQAAKMAKQLEGTGRGIHMSQSYDYRIQNRFGIKTIRKGQHGYRMGDRDDAATYEAICEENDVDPRFLKMILTFMKSDPEKIWNLTTPDVQVAKTRPHPFDELFDVSPIDESPEDVEDLYSDAGEQPEPVAFLFMTYAQLRLLHAKYDGIQDDWIIWLDDPDYQELLDIKTATPSEILADVTRKDPKLSKIGNTFYHRRDEAQSLINGIVGHCCVFTTTEKLTLHVIERYLKAHSRPFVVHGERKVVTGGNITILGTKYVQKAWDAFIPLMIVNMQRQNPETVLIADGLASELNHTNSKGRNDLTGRNIVVEVSVPHPAQIQTVIDSLGDLERMKAKDVGRTIMLDKMHQAIGRNSGFRFEGQECVVLVDLKYHAALLKECGYEYDVENSVLMDLTNVMYLTDQRIKDTATPMVQFIERFLNNLPKYFQDLRVVKKDIKSVLDTQLDLQKKKLYIERMLKAFESVGKMSFSSTTNGRYDNDLQKRLRKLEAWIRQKVIPAMT